MPGRPRPGAGSSQPQVEDLFAGGAEPHVGFALAASAWPPQSDYPVNHGGASVRHPVWDDVVGGDEATVVSGFASIGKIIELVAAREAVPGAPSLRVLLGTEPFTSARLSFGSASATFTDDVRRYWLEERGVSLLLSAKIVQTMEVLDAGRLEVRFVPGRTRLHAKIYVGQGAATVGSSNFTTTGLERQFEANVRFDRATSAQQYADVCRMAENFWEVGVDWSAELRSLLDDMLRAVSWQEALARACADLLEGQWADRYLATALGLTELWPSQRAGIAEALWVVENVGSVLVADATGSGKTRMGAHLARAVRDRLWRTGRVRSDLTVLVCPPAVELQWLREAVSCGLTLRTVSQGLLSRAGENGPRVQEQEVAGAQILAIDEAHNFLAAGSNRRARIQESMADHVLMFTATPINTGADDLLHMVDLLGADNFSDDTLRVLDNLSRRGHNPVLGSQERALLRAEVQRFTVRRTKDDFNAMVDRDPGAYTPPGATRPARYPEHRSSNYATGETHEDAQIGQEIKEHAGQLLGLARLPRTIAVPPALRGEYDDERWLSLRLGSARGLADYEVASTMRSSKAALLEHLLGTAATVEVLAIRNLQKPQPSGDVLASLTKAREQGPPVVDLACAIPDWLTDIELWRAQCDREAALYRGIEGLAYRLGVARERAKAAAVLALTERHDRILAFDRHPISLAVIAPLVAAGDVPVIVATGASTRERRDVQRDFGREATGRGIALCSDAMNEGINLQGASAVVHFDMPSTLRVAEQRVGRVDRMDSPYEVIDVWWPEDGASFRTAADDHLAARNAESTALLGSNLPIPHQVSLPVDAVLLTPDDVVEHQVWDGLHDALEPVRGLVAGPEALLTSAAYEEHRRPGPRVLARVSTVRSRHAWAFFAIVGTRHGAPRWLMVEKGLPGVEADLAAVTSRLRELLVDDPPPVGLDDESTRLLGQLLQRAARSEIELLPRRDQRALRQMHSVCRSWATARLARGEYDAAERWEAVARVAVPVVGEDEGVDLHDVAEVWWNLVKPLREELRRSRHRRRRYVTISDLDAQLLRASFPVEQVEEALRSLPVVEPMDHRVRACILGVPSSHEKVRATPV